MNVKYPKHFSEKDREWVRGVLYNDENSTDEELFEYFKSEGKVSDQWARYFVKQRAKAMIGQTL